MKKVIFTVTLIMMMAFSGLCFAADGNDLNKEQKVAETFMEVFTKDQIPAYEDPPVCFFLSLAYPAAD